MILDRFRLDGRTAIVTGAGRGIGAATALALAEAGADVVISSRTEADLKQVAGRVEQAGGRAVVVPADLAELDNLQALVAAAVDELGGIDVVVNNVGGWLPLPLTDTTVSDLEEAFHFNVSTAFSLSKRAVPHLLDSGQAAIVNISSVTGRAVGRGYLAYGTVKAALAHMTRLLARDLAPRIRVNAIAVGSVMTPALRIVAADDEVRRGIEAVTPLGRIGDPEDVAAAVVYLASAAGGYVTGKVLEVDGGTEQTQIDFDIPDLHPREDGA